MELDKDKGRRIMDFVIRRLWDDKRERIDEVTERL